METLVGKIVRLFLDTETRGPNFSQGNAKYALTVEIILLQWAIDDGPVHVEEGPSLEFLEAAETADEIWAHEAGFDRTMLETTAWWPKIPLDKWRCTAALARMHGLPGGLGKLSEIFKLGNDSKDKHGKEWINLFSKPKADGTYNDRHSHPKQWMKFRVYGGQDVQAMREVHRLCPKWNATPRMWSMWHLDQRMNARGVAVDLNLAEECVKATTIAKKQMAARTAA